MTAGPRCRRQWARWLNERTRSDGDVLEQATLGRWIRWGRGGYGIPAERRGTATTQRLWLKWVPQANPSELQLTLARMTRWRELHSHLASNVAVVSDCCAEQKLLVVEHRPGMPLSRLLEQPANPATRVVLAAHVERIAAWLRAFNAGNPSYGSEIEPLLGEHGRHDATGRLRVDARRQILCRVRQAEDAAQRLLSAGCREAVEWSRRFDLERLLAFFSEDEAGGFMHGDMKPDNVLVDGDEFAVIDWWTTPCVSWALPDAAVFAANLALCDDQKLAADLMRSFVAVYFGESYDRCVRTAMDLIGSIWLLRMAAESMRGPQGVLRRRQHAARLLEPALNGLPLPPA